MPTRNRGKHASDDRIFNDKWRPIFKEAVKDLSYLLSRNYGPKAATQIVGNQYRLNARQQKALLRMTASEAAIKHRNATCVDAVALKNKTVLIDGFNLLILLENALSGAYIFESQDGVFRDIAGVHGSYKRVIQTTKALILTAEILDDLEVEKVIWYFDAPVSNSGKMKTYLYELATKYNYNWEIHLDNNPDNVLVESDEIIISSDAWILDNCKQWFNFAAEFIERFCSEDNIICAV